MSEDEALRVADDLLALQDRARQKDGQQLLLDRA